VVHLEISALTVLNSATASDVHLILYNNQMCLIIISNKTVQKRFSCGSIPNEIPKIIGNVGWEAEEGRKGKAG
jgi:hypothetical protein